MTSPDDHTFSAVTAVVPTAAEPGSGAFKAELHDDWTIGGKPNGGYLLAILGRAAAAVGTHEHVVAASAHYLHSPDPGQVSVEVEVLRAGRSASQLRARMAQGDRPCVEALITTSRLDPQAQPYWATGVPDGSAAAIADCVRLPGVTPKGVAVPIMDRIDLRLDPDVLGFTTGRPRGRGELRGWLELPGEGFDPVSLLFALDAFPPATFDIELTGWVPTLELTAYVRALPAPGPVRVLQRAHLVDGQRVDEACFVWDSTGRLVASATQLAGIRLG